MSQVVYLRIPKISFSVGNAESSSFSSNHEETEIEKSEKFISLLKDANPRIAEVDAREIDIWLMCHQLNRELLYQAIFLILGKARVGIEIQSNCLKKRGYHETNGSVD